MQNKENTGFIIKEIGGEWLTNGRLQTCILKLTAPTENECMGDDSRAGNLDIVAQLLAPREGLKQSLLGEEFPDKPALVLAPELAFGSRDFESLDAIVRQYSQNLIFICGFGFTEGINLIRLAARPGVEGIWNTPPNASKKYNCGWAWIKQGDTTTCYIFLKKFPEQGKETSIVHWSGGGQYFAPRSR